MIVAKTERLKLLKITLSDAPFLFELMNSPHWIKYIGDRQIRTIADAENHIKKNVISSYDNFGFGFYKVQLKTTEEPIGTCGLIKREQLEVPDIGFAFLPQFERNGYGHESSVAVLELAKEEFKIPKLGAITSQENKNSINLIEKLGLTFEKKVKPFENEEEVLFFAKEL